MKKEEAREAFNRKDKEKSQKVHDSEDPTIDSSGKAHSERHQKGGEYLRSAVFGGLDGIITTYSVVMGSLGANLSPAVVLIMGISNVIGDGIAMALGDYLSTKSEGDFVKMERKREDWEIENNPIGEKNEMINLYVTIQQRGMPIEDATLITEKISKNKTAWLEIMMTEELQLGQADEHPIQNALATFTSFILFGLVSLIPFIISQIAHIHKGTFIASTILVGVFLIILGIVKSIFTNKQWYISAGETLFLGTCSAASAYLIGLAFEPLTQ